MPSPRARDSSSHASPSGPDPTACASGRSLGGIRSAIPTTCASALAAAFLVAGCGGGHAAAPGRAIFSSSCSGCHTLTGHDTRARGGDLAIADLSVAEIVSFVRVMPVRLTPAEESEVAAYVHAAFRRRY